MSSLDGSNLGLFLCNALGDESIVFGLLLLLALDTAAFERAEVTATLETDGGDKTLDLRGFGVRLGLRILLALNLPPDNVFPDVVLLAEVEESPDLGSPLGTETFGEDRVGEAWDLRITLLDDDEGEDGDIGADDATTNGLALAFTSSADTVARVTIGEEEADTVGDENTLLHGEALLVISTGDTENVALPFVTD